MLAVVELLENRSLLGDLFAEGTDRVTTPSEEAADTRYSRLYDGLRNELDADGLETARRLLPKLDDAVGRRLARTQERAFAAGFAVGHAVADHPDQTLGSLLLDTDLIDHATLWSGAVMETLHG